MPDSINEQVQQAKSAHSNFDQLYRWSLQQAADFRAKAEMIDHIHEEMEEEEAEELLEGWGSANAYREAADRIQTVWQRIEAGDGTRRQALQ